MKRSLMLAALLITGCANDRYMGDNPTIGPQRPASDLKVEMEAGNLVCVTENNDAATRSCVPIVHQPEDKS